MASPQVVDQWGVGDDPQACTSPSAATAIAARRRIMGPPSRGTLCGMKEYYDRRAPEYESIYGRDDAVRREEQSALAAVIREAARDRDVLDVACGTGYWTKEAAATARSAVGVDASPAMLEEARAKQLGRSVRF